ncbi:hypothetical protein UA08_07293 [Talaromyces atroroseus]|uniref:Membrane anchor Opy2 N-terminal domain-containing protein n=1 Tax=Talaromyces atroroseus TaxID=1441469 RepID=A0A225A9P2_TALAT|nr:hypothetical protein UA08_07293 [Talaromyces atroroseus]OKL57611.1 hypothetical protein UA08_07293 [Talaromyces atroroseus]
MNESFLFERQVNTCSPPYQFYQCSISGQFSGCCSLDPCDDGICPAENQPGGSSQSTTSETTSISSTSLSNQEQTVTVTASAAPSSLSSQTTAALETSATRSLSDLDQDQTVTMATATMSSSLSSASLSTSIGKTDVVTTTVAAAISSTNTPTQTPSETSTSSNNKAVLIGSSVGGVVGIMALFLMLFLCCRRRKTSKTLNSSNNEKRAHKRTFSGFQEDSDYNLSSSWSQPSEDYYRQQHKTSPLGHVDRTRSPALTELDSNPRGSPLKTYSSVLSKTVYELDSSVNEGSTTTPTRASSSDPLNANLRSVSTSSPASQRAGSRLGDHLWQSSESDTMSNGSSAMSGGIRLARSGELSVRSE